MKQGVQGSFGQGQTYVKKTVIYYSHAILNVPNLSDLGS